MALFKNRNSYAFALLSFAIYALIGCQTVPTTDASRIATGKYSSEFDQGDHFNKLIAEKNFSLAVWLFETENEYFNVPANRAALASSLREMADHFNDGSEARKDLLSSLQSTIWPTTSSQWREIHQNLKRAHEVLHAYTSELLLADPTYGSKDIRDLKTVVLQLEERMRNSVQSEFDKFDHFGPGRFFSDYPVTLLNTGSTDVIFDSSDREYFQTKYEDFDYSSLSGKLEAADIDELRAFADHYYNSDFFPESVELSYLKGYERNQRKTLSKGSLPLSVVRLWSIAATLENNYVTRRSSDPSVQIINAPGTNAANSGQPTFSAVIGDDLSGTPVKAEDQSRTEDKLAQHRTRAVSNAASLIVFIGQPDSRLRQQTLSTETILSERPVQTKRRINPDWETAKAEFERIDKLYQEAGGDEEYELPLKQYGSGQAYCGGGLAGCAIGSLIGGFIVGAAQSSERHKRKELTELHFSRATAEDKLQKTQREIATHTYGEYAFEKIVRKVTKEIRVKIVTADIETNTYAIQEYRTEDEFNVTVMDGIADLDKMRDIHLVGKITAQDYTKIATEEHRVGLSEVITTYPRTEIARGRFSTKKELMSKVKSNLAAFAAIN